MKNRMNGIISSALIKWVRKGVSCLLLAFFILCVTPFALSVSAEEYMVEDMPEGQKCDLTIKVHFEDDSNNDGETETFPVSGMSIRLYKTAELSTSAGKIIFTNIPQFTRTGINYETMDASDSLKAADSLSKYVGSMEPDREGITNTDGIIVFEGLDPGMYLAVQTNVSSGAGKAGGMQISPCLWMVPQLEYDKSSAINRWMYQTEVFPKAGTVIPPETESESQTEVPPVKPPDPPEKRGNVVKTGDNTQVHIFAGIMIASLVVMIIILARRKRRP